MDLEKGTETLDKADGFLTKLKSLLKKHWGILLILLLGFGIYKFIVAVGEEMDNPTTTPIEQPYYQEEVYQEEQPYNEGETYQEEQPYYEEETYQEGDSEYHGDTYDEE